MKEKNALGKLFFSLALVNFILSHLSLRLKELIEMLVDFTNVVHDALQRNHWFRFLASQHFYLIL